MKLKLLIAALAVAAVSMVQAYPLVDLTNPNWLAYGAHETITVPSTGPFVLENTLVSSDTPKVRVYINGGTISAVEYHQHLWGSEDWVTYGSTPPYVDLNPGDSLRLTYTALSPPAMRWHPL